MDGYILKRVIDRDIAEEDGSYDNEWVTLADLDDMHPVLRTFADDAARMLGVDTDDFVAAAAEYRASGIMRDVWRRWLVT